MQILSKYRLNLIIYDVLPALIFMVLSNPGIPLATKARPHPQIKRAKGGRVWPKDQVVRGSMQARLRDTPGRAEISDRSVCWRS